MNRWCDQQRKFLPFIWGKWDYQKLCDPLDYREKVEWSDTKCIVLFCWNLGLNIFVWLNFFTFSLFQFLSFGNIPNLMVFLYTLNNRYECNTQSSKIADCFDDFIKKYLFSSLLKVVFTMYCKLIRSNCTSVVSLYLIIIMYGI